jgi:hypothetical protein
MWRPVTTWLYKPESGVPLETCWAFNKLWNNKFDYKLHFVVIFTQSYYGCTNPWISNFFFHTVPLWDNYEELYLMHDETPPYLYNVLPLVRGLTNIFQISGLDVHQQQNGFRQFLILLYVIYFCKALEYRQSTGKIQEHMNCSNKFEILLQASPSFLKQQC